MNNLLLDTHILIWLMNGDNNLAKHLQAEIQRVCATGYLYVSVISIWEVSLLYQKGRISIGQPINQWVEQLAALPYIKIVNIDHKIALESTILPHDFHSDPADRIIVATARILNKKLVTVDQKIIDYAKLYSAVNVLH